MFPVNIAISFSFQKPNCFEIDAISQLISLLMPSTCLVLDSSIQWCTSPPSLSLQGFPGFQDHSDDLMKTLLSLDFPPSYLGWTEYLISFTTFLKTFLVPHYHLLRCLSTIPYDNIWRQSFWNFIIFRLGYGNGDHFENISSKIRWKNISSYFLPFLLYQVYT